MNRRKFFGAMLVPFGAVAAAKYQLVLPESEYTTIRDRFRQWFEPMPKLAANPQPVVWGTSICDTNLHRSHQEHLSRWLAEQVDQAAFKMMKGDLDGQKS